MTNKCNFGVNSLCLYFLYYVTALSPRCHTTLQDVWDNLYNTPAGILDGLVSHDLFFSKNYKHIFRFLTYKFSDYKLGHVFSSGLKF